jgi:hypothetical protein
MTNENLFDPCLRDDEKAFLHYLHASGAKYVVIGGHAVLLYVGDRETGVNDLDVVIECSHENAVKVFNAVEDYAPRTISEQRIDELAQPRKKLPLSINGTRIDIMTSTDSTVLSFDDLWRDRCEVPVSVALGNPPRRYEFNASFVSKAHLLQLKQEAINDPNRDEKGREQDQKDVESLQ